MGDRNRLETMDHHHESEEQEEEVFLPATIFDAQFLGESVPKGFDAVRVALDGKLKADLSWSQERAAALEYIKQGLRIFWEIDLGLFGGLKHPLDNQMQFLSLSLSLQHFRDTLWNEFRAQTFGLGVYRGVATFEDELKWNDLQNHNLRCWLRDGYGNLEELSKELGTDIHSFEAIDAINLGKISTGRDLLSLFCRDTAAEYLNLLVSKLPDTLNCLALFDVERSRDKPLLSAQLVSKERYPKMIVGIKGPPYLGGEFSWEGPKKAFGFIGRQKTNDSNPAALESLGICLPPIKFCRLSVVEPLQDAMRLLCQQGVPFRVIPEDHLTAQWEGLDHLVVLSQAVSAAGRRKLQGFCAAGGKILVIGQALGLPEEEEFAKYLLMRHAQTK